jgi:hypothetical protein
MHRQNQRSRWLPPRDFADNPMRKREAAAAVLLRRHQIDDASFVQRGEVGGGKGTGAVLSSSAAVTANWSASRLAWSSGAAMSSAKSAALMQRTPSPRGQTMRGRKNET